MLLHNILGKRVPHLVNVFLKWGKVHQISDGKLPRAFDHGRFVVACGDSECFCIKVISW